MNYPHNGWLESVNKVGTNQCQEESPIWGAVKKETLFNANNSTVKQYNCGNRRALRPLSSWTALLCSLPVCFALPWSALVCSGLCWFIPLWWDIFGVSAQLEESELSEPEGRWHVDRSQIPRFLIGLSSCKWGLQILAVWLLPKALSWLVKMGPL